MATGGASKFNEIARNQNASSHRASPDRTYVMQQLGLQTPGFWADWAARRINPYGEQTATEQAALPQTPQLKAITPYQSQTWANTPTALTDLDKHKNVPMSPGGATGAPPSQNTGRTKAALQQAEKNITWGLIRGQIASTPTLSTTVLDTMDAERINMNRQMMLYMNANSSKMLTDAAADYFNRHPAYSAIESAQTNFEKQTSLYTETRQMAAKQVGYGAAEANKQIDKAIKNPKNYSAPQYMGGTMLNIQNQYGGTRYLSSFG